MQRIVIALLTSASATNVNPFAEMVKPFIDLVNMMLTPAITLVGVIGTIYCVLLGAKLAKAEEPQEHQKAKGALKNAIVGFALIFVLVAAMKVGIDPLTDWMESAMQGKYYDKEATSKADSGKATGS